MYKEDMIYQHRVEMIGGKEHYFISFFDVHNNVVSLEVNRKIYLALQETNRIETRIGRSDRRHIDKTIYSDRDVYTRAAFEYDTTEKLAVENERNEKLVLAIESLPPVQRRRFLMFHVHGLLLKDIAVIEGATIAPVHRSIQCAEKKIRKMLKKYY